MKDAVRVLIFPNFLRCDQKVWPKNAISTALPLQDVHQSTVEQCERQAETRETDERQSDANESQPEEGQCSKRQSEAREANERQAEAREKQREEDKTANHDQTRGRNKSPTAIGEDLRAKLDGEPLPERFINLSCI